MSKKKDIESIHYLSPLQEGLLFHAVADAAADPYFTQTGFVIDGELEVRRRRGFAAASLPSARAAADCRSWRSLSVRSCQY